MNFVINPRASSGSRSMCFCSFFSLSPATVLISVCGSKFFASFLVAHIWRLDLKAAGVFIDHSGFSCDGFSENR